MATFGKTYCWKGRLLGGKYGPVPPNGIDYLLKLPAEKKYLLMCMEADPLKCHRYLDLGLRLLERGLNITHIVQTMNGWQLWTTSELKGEPLWT
jgi:hypothetical protein